MIDSKQKSQIRYFEQIFPQNCIDIGPAESLLKRWAIDRNPTVEQAVKMLDKTKQNLIRCEYLNGRPGREDRPRYLAHVLIEMWVEMCSKTIDTEVQ